MTQKLERETAFCVVCGQPLGPEKRAHARYCSAACSQTAYRDRVGGRSRLVYSTTSTRRYRLNEARAREANERSPGAVRHFVSMTEWKLREAGVPIAAWGRVLSFMQVEFGATEQEVEAELADIKRNLPQLFSAAPQDRRPG